MHRPPYEVLFLCTGNSARSILAERLLEHHGAGRFRGHSAGSFPRGSVHPLALALLTEAGLPTAALCVATRDHPRFGARSSAFRAHNS